MFIRSGGVCQGNRYKGNRKIFLRNKNKEKKHQICDWKSQNECRKNWQLQRYHSLEAALRIKSYSCFPCEWPLLKKGALIWYAWMADSYGLVCAAILYHRHHFQALKVTAKIPTTSSSGKTLRYIYMEGTLTKIVQAISWLTAFSFPLWNRGASSQAGSLHPTSCPHSRILPGDHSE